MLIAFALENHRSIRERQVLNLEATKDDHLEESRVITHQGQRLLRSAALYGPNASGKSNLFEGLHTMREIVLAAAMSNRVVGTLPTQPFLLSTSTANAPSTFEVEFWLDDIRYRYGFTADKENIRAEWFKRKRKNTETMLFEREGQVISTSQVHFKEGQERKQFVRPNALFLSLCAELNGELSSKIVGWFQKLTLLSGREDKSLFFLTAQQLKDPAQNVMLTNFVQKADLNIVGLRTKEAQFDQTLIPPGATPKLQKELHEILSRAHTEIKTSHKSYDFQGVEVGRVEMDLFADGSQGTKKFVSLSGPLHQAIAENSILFLDEFEARLHPLLTQAIIEWFHGPQNTSRAQLIIATHDILLMDPERIRRDQVWFCEKDEKGASQLYSLAEFDPDDVRPTTKFSRRYLMGLFGAIPKTTLHQQDIPDVAPL